MDKKVVSNSDLKKALGLHGVFGSIMVELGFYVFGFHKIVKYIDNDTESQGAEFVAQFLNNMDVSAGFDEEQLSNIPDKGGFVVVSNHPFGGIEGLLLYQIVTRIRPDFKLMANYLLSLIPNLKDSIFEVNPFTSNPEWNDSRKGLRSSIRYLTEEHGVGIFPAGEVSRYHEHDYPEDLPWSLSIARLIKNIGVPVVPVFWKGQNSRIFYSLDKMHTLLGTLQLPRELANKHNKCLPMQIGMPISPAEMAKYEQPKDLAAYLRARTYALEANIDWPKKEATTIAPDIPVEDPEMELEINRIRKKSLLFSAAHYECYTVDYSDAPNLMQEIFRLREETFQSVGEGTGKKLDQDPFDPYYKHLVLWDNTKHRIAGGFRFGLGNEIIQNKGINGFIISTLFDIEDSFSEYLGKSIELGRFFIASDYQQKGLPLRLLLRSLSILATSHPEMEYYIGPVSISSWYPKFYQGLIMEYLSRKHFVEPKLAGQLQSHNPFHPDFLKADVEALLEKNMDSIEEFNKFLFHLSNGKIRIPSLMRKYLKINAKVLGFNVDAAFNDSFDALFFARIAVFPENEIKPLLRKQ